MEPTFFATPAHFRKWLDKYAGKKTELLVGFHKVGSGKASITWPESVDEALCHGWIDGVRKRIDEVSYTIRFSPRKARSIWSAVNIKRMQVLTEGGRVKAAGLKAFAAREENRSGIYSYEQRLVELPDDYGEKLQRNPQAAAFFAAQPPSYRKAVVWWVVCAKQEVTRQKRLDQLIADSAREQRIAQLTALTKR
jgi:uncharacterized protein YdeI (YjbR/CyaY-like superfamily)